MKSLAPTIAITGGKGGVGKSSLTSNLAFALAALGRRVLVLDADYGLANLDLMLGLRPLHTLRDVVAGQRTMRQVVLNGPCGLRLIPASSGLPLLADLDPEVTQALLKDLEGLRSEADVLLVDTAAGIGRAVTRMLRASEQVVVVTTPDPAAVVDAYALTKVVLVEEPAKDLRLLVNLTRGPDEGVHVHRQIDRACRAFLGRGIEFLGAVPEDDALVRSLRLRRPLLESEPGSPAGRSLGRIALALDHRLQGATSRSNGNLRSFWGAIFSRADAEGDRP